MGICWVSDCLRDANQKCSGCKTATYCSSACQKENWKHHKKECKLQRMVYDMEQKREEEEKINPPPKPRKTHCTGCNERFKEDWVEVDQECPDCGYITCESCSCSNSRGSCYCQDSNFGYAYCSQEPRSYHRGKKGGFMGDYHPAKEDGYDLNKDDCPKMFEKEPRPCNRCGKVVQCLRKEYRTVTF
ncbi:unnamed protein product [Cyclocybe aegerita]|uniref:MYND-type domain-containing protein n=1 Tax=Cyclocybe aegerita TaxID=1973307 RepID=A0A8S0WK28_CYCAE|nr:unnamed protein product [Cyclocybe aegerita]